MKEKRQRAIIELIEKEKINTQEEIVVRLREKGYNVTQATVSRDIREMKLKKRAADGGGQRYTAVKDDAAVPQRFERVFKDGIVSIEQAQNIVVIKTIEGMAMGVAAALDSMAADEILGSIAGDDTIFCAAAGEKAAERFIKRLKKSL